MLEIDKEQKVPASRSAAAWSQPTCSLETITAALRVVTVAYERERTHHSLYKHALRLVDSPEVANDIVQEAFVDTTAKIGRGTEIAHLGAYLDATVRNIALQQRRRRAWQPLEDELEKLEPTQANLPSEAAQIRQRCTAIYEAVRQLPSAQRSAFLMAELQGLHYREIASDLNRTENAVRQLLSRARSAIRAAVGPNGAPLSVPVVEIKARVSHALELPTHSDTLGSHLSIRLSDTQSSLGWLLTRSAEIASHASQPAATLVAAAVAVGTVAVPTPSSQVATGPSADLPPATERQFESKGISSDERHNGPTEMATRSLPLAELTRKAIPGAAKPPNPALQDGKSKAQADPNDRVAPKSATATLAAVAGNQSKLAREQVETTNQGPGPNTESIPTQPPSPPCPKKQVAKQPLTVVKEPSSEVTDLEEGEEDPSDKSYPTELPLQLQQPCSAPLAQIAQDP